MAARLAKLTAVFCIQDLVPLTWLAWSTLLESGTRQTRVANRRPVGALQ
jgi:hypothetical protein